MIIANSRLNLSLFLRFRIFCEDSKTLTLKFLDEEVDVFKPDDTMQK